MDKGKKGFFSPVVLLVISVIAVGVVGYLLATQQLGSDINQSVGSQINKLSPSKSGSKDSEFVIDVLDYTRDVENICQPVEFKLLIKNQGEDAITLDQLENRDYILAVNQVTESTESARLDEASGPTAKDKLEGFDRIEPGKEQEITYLGMNELVILEKGADPVGENFFVGLPKNGKYDLKFVVEKRNEDGSREVIAESETFDVNQKSLIEDGIFKACH